MMFNELRRPQKCRWRRKINKSVIGGKSPERKDGISSVKVMCCGGIRLVCAVLNYVVTLLIRYIYIYKPAIVLYIFFFDLY